MRVEVLDWIDSGVDGPPAPGSLAAADPVADLIDQRWRAMREHASQVPPYDAMDPDLQLAFLGTDRLRRVDPPWVDAGPEQDWIATCG